MKKIALIATGFVLVCFTLPLIPTIVKDQIIGESIFVIGIGMVGILAIVWGIKTPYSQKGVKETTTSQNTKTRQHIIKLGHYSHISDYQRATPGYAVKGTWKENYVTQPLTIMVPDKGKMVTRIKCNVCGEELFLEVDSPRNARFRQILVLIVFVLLSIPIPFLIIVDIVFLVVLFLPIPPHDLAHVSSIGSSQNKHKLFENKDK